MNLISVVFSICTLTLLHSCSNGDQAELNTSSTDVQEDFDDSPRRKVFLLKDGTELLGNSLGLEESLLNYLNSEVEKTDTSWFTFDRLVFNDGSSEINVEESEEQLENTAQILRRFKNTTVVIGGFSSRQTNTADDMLLSQQRAQAVTNALVLLGVNGKLLKPEGYGPQGISQGDEKVALAFTGL